MLNKVKSIVQIMNNMGARYVAFRISFELSRRLSFFKKKFPTDVSVKEWIKLEDWKNSKARFFFSSKEDLLIEKVKSEVLANEAENIFNGRIKFFNAFFTKLAGTKKLQQQIEKGVSESEIRASWKQGLEKFKEMRKKYLIYE